MPSPLWLVCNITSVAHFDAVGGGIHPIKKLKRQKIETAEKPVL
jgi:hypothetical protein